MSTAPCKLSLDEWDARYAELKRAGLNEAFYGGPLRRHVVLDNDLRLRHLRFDNSSASLRLWNFLLTENERLAQARAQGSKSGSRQVSYFPIPAFDRLRGAVETVESC